eukprot:4422065-Pyramimonas_sp.AAC.1
MPEQQPNPRQTNTIARDPLPPDLAGAPAALGAMPRSRTCLAPIAPVALPRSAWSWGRGPLLLASTLDF